MNKMTSWRFSKQKSASDIFIALFLYIIKLDRSPVKMKKTREISPIQEFQVHIWQQMCSFYKEYSCHGQQLSYNTVKSIIDTITTDPYHVEYLTKAIFCACEDRHRFDKDRSGGVSFTQLGNQLLRFVCAKQAIQHQFVERQRACLRNGTQFSYVVDEKTFGKLLKNTLGFINVDVPELIISLLFRRADADKDKQITFAEYLTVVKQNFCLPDPNRHKYDSSYEIFFKDFEQLNPRQRFEQMLKCQFSDYLKKYKCCYNGQFYVKEIKEMLKNVFKYDDWQISRIMRKFPQNCSCFHMDQKELICKLLCLYFAKSPFVSDKAIGGKPNPNHEIGEWQFSYHIYNLCYFVRFKPSHSDLRVVFRQLDRSCKGYILYSQYEDFILQSFGRKFFRDEKDSNNPEKDDLVMKFPLLLWKDLQEMYNQIGCSCRRKNYITYYELTQYICKNYAFNYKDFCKKFNLQDERFDPNSDYRVSLDQFGQFFLIQVIQEIFNNYNLRNCNRAFDCMDWEDFDCLTSESFKILPSYSNWKRNQVFRTIFISLSEDNKIISRELFFCWRKFLMRKGKA